MPDDIIKRLRSGSHNVELVTLAGVTHDGRCLDAADEIERLKKEMNHYESIREALRNDWLGSVLRDLYSKSSGPAVKGGLDSLL